MNQLATLWERIRTSLWFFPGVITGGAGVLAWAALRVQLDLDEAVWWLHGGDAQNAFQLLASFLTAIMTAATLAISITIVVLTLAAGQLGPRLIRSFVGDWRTQASLGVFLAAIVYLVLVLRSLHGGMDEAAVPQFAVTVATVLVILSVLVLLFYTHHLSRSIVADSVIRRVGRQLDGAIERLLPERAAHEPQPVALIGETGGDGAWLALDRAGYVQAVDYPALSRAAKSADAVVSLRLRAGQHLLPGGRYVQVFPGARITDQLRHAVEEAVLTGSERTATQDLEFAVRQLVEIAARALATQDAFTAIAVIDRLSLSLAKAIPRGPAQAVWKDDGGEIRVVADTTEFTGLLDAAFHQVRQTGEAHPAVLIRLLRRLRELHALAEDDTQRRALVTHAEMVLRAGHRTMQEPNDLSDLQQQWSEEEVAAARRGLEDR